MENTNATHLDDSFSIGCLPSWSLLYTAYHIPLINISNRYMSLYQVLQNFPGRAKDFLGGA